MTDLLLSPYILIVNKLVVSQTNLTFVYLPFVNKTVIKVEITHTKTVLNFPAPSNGECYDDGMDGLKKRNEYFIARKKEVRSHKISIVTLDIGKVVHVFFAQCKNVSGEQSSPVVCNMTSH
jgi:hypothetical protein